VSLWDQPPVFVVGAQRSGTTWLQRLLAAHPLLVAGQESHLFSAYLAPLWERWRLEEDLRSLGHRRVGLGCTLSEAQFLESLRRFARDAFAPLEGVKPGAVRLVEKTPDHALHLPLIHRLFPDAAVVHVLRDGRDVVASLRAAHRQQWGRVWTPAGVEEAARRWAEWVAAVRAHAGLFRHFHEVRYEDLLERGPDCLGRLFDSLGVPLPAEQVGAIYEQYRFGACAGRAATESLATPAGDARTVQEPAGFFRRGEAGGWVEELTEREKDLVHAIAGPLLQELDYPVFDSGALNPSAEPAGFSRRGNPGGSPSAPLFSEGFRSTAPRGGLLWARPRRLEAVESGNAQLLDRERLFLYATVLALAPERCLEIGVAQGGSSRIIADALRDLGRGQLIGVDLRPALSFDPAELSGVASFLEGRSPDVLPQAARRAGGPFDFVLLDGDHSRDGVLLDLEGLARCTKPWAVVLAHDAYYPPVAAGIDAALALGLPFVDAGLLATTRHPGIENGQEVAYAGFRLLVRKARGSAWPAVLRRLPRKVARQLKALVLGGPRRSGR
jgi:predicted O-methyltransferase YrrM